MSRGRCIGSAVGRSALPGACLSALLALGPILGCDGLDPAVGPPIADRCSNEDSDPSTSVSFARDVAPLFRGQAGPAGCNCHLAGDPSPIGLQESGLELTSYASLRRGGARSGAAIVIPGRPCESILWQKLSAGPPFGARMPFAGPPFVSDEARLRIADWIAEGALEN
jgi:hypothetical protein